MKLLFFIKDTLMAMIDLSTVNVFFANSTLNCNTYFVYLKN